MWSQTRQTRIKAYAFPLSTQISTFNGDTLFGWCTLSHCLWCLLLCLQEDQSQKCNKKLKYSTSFLGSAFDLSELSNRASFCIANRRTVMNGHRGQKHNHSTRLDSVSSIPAYAQISSRQTKVVLKLRKRAFEPSLQKNMQAKS